MEIMEFHWTRDFLLSIANLTLPWALRRPPHFLCAAGIPFELACSGSMAVSIFLRILAGLPAATWKGGTSL
jgi:hypothetical protein